MDWKCVDEKLVRCGELLLSLDFLEGYSLELRIKLEDHLSSPEVIRR
jgi:hypothetical protein